MNAMSVVERRINLRLLSYWEKLRSGRDMPAPEEFDGNDLPDLWDRCFLLHVAELHKADSKYAHLGQMVIDSYHDGTTKGASGPMICLDPRKSADHFSEVCKTLKPLLSEGEFTNEKGEIIRYRQCLLPLGRSGQVESIFGGMHFKVFE